MRNYLKELRKTQGFTQHEIADLIGISATYYCMIENGERQQKMDLPLGSMSIK